MKKIIILFLFLSQNIFGQDSASKCNEIYLIVSSFSNLNLGLQYKKQITNNLYFRLGVANVSINNYKNPANTAVEYNNFIIDEPETKSGTYNLNIGIEKRINFNQKVSFFYGSSFIGGYNSYEFTGRERNTQKKIAVSEKIQSYGLGIHLGGIIKLAKSLYISAELTPTYSLGKRTKKVYDSDNVFIDDKTPTKSFNLSTQQVAIAIMYRLCK